MIRNNRSRNREKDLKIRSSPPPFENNVIILISRLFEMEISSKVFSEF